MSLDDRPYLSHYVEPLLEFRFGQRLVYPRDGLFLFGPVGNLSQVPSVRYGVIGTIDGVARFRTWAKSVSGFIAAPEPGLLGRAVEPQHVPFPGFAEAFHTSWPPEPAVVINDVTTADLERCLFISNRHEAVRGAVDLFYNRLVAANNRLENPPALWFVVIPELVYRLGRPKSKPPHTDVISSTVRITVRRARELQTKPTLFGDEEREAEVYQYATHFRRQLKARLLKERIVTQLVRETTLAPEDFRLPSGKLQRAVEDPATIAWKLCTAAYYKAGGKPWQLADVRPGVCYVGLVYKRADLLGGERHACCAAQMFLNDGDGVVFRGALGPWFQPDTKQFHLDRLAAENLIRTVVHEYVNLHGKPPRELFLHSRSAFSDDEWNGFTAGAPAETNLVGIQIYDSREDLKLFRPGSYPVLRGTALCTGRRSAFLWTTGYVPRLDTYMGPETPNPIRVTIIRGDSTLSTVLTDILGLTKINFNSCLHNDRLPVTIRFADAIGDVLVSAPIEGEPKLPFKYYI